MRRLCLLLLILPAAADDPEISGARALEVVKRLAADDFGGRKSGLASGRKAEDWMAEQCAAIGLAPWNGASYFQEFKASVTEERGGPPRFAIQGVREGKYLDDYVSLLYSGEGEVEAQVVFAGYGIHAPDKGRDDYAGLDVKGRIVLAVRGKPEGSRFQEERLIGYKSSTAADRGAVGFLLVEGDQAIPGTIQEKYHRANLPAAWLARAAADDLFKAAGKPDLAAQVKALQAGKPASFPLEGVRVRLEIRARLLKDRPVRNVLGLWPGKTDEYVVLGAHLDHVGMDAVGNVYNGADDNASGSAMLHEVARAIAARGRTFRRTLVFCWFAGEEQGLLGSRAFVEQPPVPLEKIAVMINTDMVGQGKPVLAVGGSEIYPRDAGFLHDFEFEGFTIRRFRAGGNSDHFPFVSRGVPAFFLHTQGPHPNYHRPADDWQHIRPELLATAGRFLRQVAELAAQSDAPHCRPLRFAEYVWHDSYADDLEVTWCDDLVAVDRELTRLEQKGAPQNVFASRTTLGPLLRDLRPTVLLGLRGGAATRLCGPAGRMGVLLFAPWRGPDPGGDLAGLVSLARRRPVVLCPDGAPDDIALLDFPGGLCVDAREAPRWDWSTRKGPWVVVVRTDDAAQVIALRRSYGDTHLVVVSGHGIVAGLLEAGLKPADVRRLLGGNFVRMLEAVTKKG
ncbi:MAG: M28 family peptidase [Planctomycetota bacterium]